MIRATVYNIVSTLSFVALPTTPPTRTPPTPRNINIPEWALSLWNVGQTIVSFLAGTGIGVLGVCCCNKCKQRRKDRKRHKGPKHDLESGLGSEVTVPSKCKLDCNDTWNLANNFPIVYTITRVVL